MLKILAPYDCHTREKKTKAQHQPQSSSTSRPFSGFPAPTWGRNCPFINRNSLHYPWFVFLKDPLFFVFSDPRSKILSLKNPWPFVVHGILNDFCKSLKIFTSRSDEASGFETNQEVSKAVPLRVSKKNGFKATRPYQKKNSDLRWIPRMKLWKTYVPLNKLDYICPWKYLCEIFHGNILSLWKLNYYPPESHRKQIFTSGDLVNQDDQWKSHEVLSMFPGCYLCFKRTYLLKHLVPLAN